MEKVKHIRIDENTTISDLMFKMESAGVLGAGRLGRATSILTKILEDPDIFTFLAISGPLVPGGMRYLFADMIRDGFVDVIITSGANLVHDLLEAWGGYHIIGSMNSYDPKLREEGIGRIGDIFTKNEHFETLETNLHNFFDKLSDDGISSLTPSELMYKLGEQLSDENSIIRQAYLHNVKIFSPGLLDSMIGFHIWTYNQFGKMNLDFVKDMQYLSDLIFEVKKTGAIILGGGLTKHYTMGANILRDGLDYAIQITMDRPETGSLSGTPLNEGISWQKLRTSARFETVVGDVTALFPIILAAAYQRLKK